MKKKGSESLIPVSEPALTDRELNHVMACVRSGWISSSGPFIDKFESRWASYCGRKYGVAVANGTVALELAVGSLRLEPGSEIILPSFTIISCAHAVIRNHCVPVLVDVEPLTGCMNVDQIEKKITKRTQAIMPVHIYGHPVDMDRVTSIAKRYGLYVVEDAAEAHGAEYCVKRDSRSPVWRRCGSFGELSIFSFYANKLITTGEGGMVLTDDPRLAQRLRSMRNLSFGKKIRFCHEEAGFNFRLTNLQASLAVSQISRMKKIIQRKREIADFYKKKLSGLKHVSLLRQEPWARSICWMFGIIVSEKSGMDARALAQKLKKEGVETRPFFLGMHEQPVLKKLGFFKGERYPTTEFLARQGLYLPSGLNLTSAQMIRVCDGVRRILS